MELTGIHHLTAISAAIGTNHRFYTRTLGMRLVKRSVNQDDVSAYHLFYADAKGTPGTDLTFFDWPAPPEGRGTRSIVRTGLRINGQASLKWWLERFDEFRVSHGDLIEPDRPVPMGELASALSCDASNVTGLVDRLESRGLLQRSPSETDRRVKVLSLTPLGARIRASMLERLTSSPPTLGRLSAADQRALARILRRLLE